MSFNPTFRPVATSPPGRSPSPPRRFVEPLSPQSVSIKPVPLEPSFNYPPINDNVHFTVRPEQAQDSYNATPKSRVRSDSYKSGHHRTPSTIDTLAEAALAVSPSFHAPAARTQHVHAASYAHSGPSGHGLSEPPHKRARSEILPSPLISQYASRPATSYEHGQPWYGSSNHPTSAGNAYDSRIEEASLLLNFRTGGLPANTQNLPPPPPPPNRNGNVPAGPRPHANSFPQSTCVPRPSDLTSQAGLLPPFATPSHAPTPPMLASSPHMNDVSGSNLQQQHRWHVGPKPIQIAPSSCLVPSPNVEMSGAPSLISTETSAAPGIGSAPGAEIATGETSDATSKTRRSGLNGRSKMANRKSGRDKAALRKSTSRKKTPDPPKTGTRFGETLIQYAAKRGRRKSFSDVPRLPLSELVATSSQRTRSVPPDTPMVIWPTPLSKPSRRANKTVDNIVCAGCETTRETSSLNGELDEWISCNGCKKWFHVDCAGFKKAAEVRDVDKYFCVICEPSHGKTTFVRKSSRAHVSVDYAELQRGVLKTSEESMEHHYVQPIKDGTFQFDPETFPRMRPELVTKEFFEKSGAFVEPICIPAEWNPRPWLEKQTESLADGRMPGSAKEPTFANLMPDDYEYDTVVDEGQDKLDMIMPENLTVRQVCNLVGPDVPLDVIDVKTQNSGAKWTLGRWADYYEEKTEDKPIRNVISLEVSQSKLGRLLRRPKVVRDIDLQDQVWPRKEIDSGKYPKVQYYCLMSVADSYTDFHIDFGGSSVYYHILKGKKTFFFIPPKMKHLKAYEEWNDSPQQNYTFLPNITKECYRVDLREGDTMLIPSGWIHAVWTPETSLVIGGNFLSRMAYKNQFRIVEIEKNNNTPMKFRYPFFQKLMWYTAIQYLEQDPLPDAVSQLFLQGQKFERQTPIWADFDGQMAANDDRPGAKNARYYSQAEVEGLPDLCNYIFRTVMLVMGRVEGISADRMKRVNASIPKGHGEPLDIAKTFALWVAWKCGNEDPPAWAHPSAVLPASKEEGAPKKLSARALKDMERKEAIAAWRVAPDRQSARVKNAASSASPAASGPLATPEHTSSYHAPPSTTHLSSHDTFNHQMALPQAMPVAQPMHLMLSEMAGHHISTPKTSVLGPKRVACDACRKRRIRCKHKDLVMQAPTVPHMSSSDLHDNIIVTPPRPQQSAKYLADSPDAQQNGIHSGTNAYFNSNVPMAINGSPVFGDSAKRGRSKACFDCRKSKRRCIHDENGNVDPVKAAETPVPRGSNSSKKRPAEDGTPVQMKKKPKQSPSEHASSQQSMVAANGLVPTPNAAHQAIPDHPEMPVMDKSARPDSGLRNDAHEQQPPLDPSLFSSYPEPVEDDAYRHSYPYPATNPYQIQSLEQIASEVLDMNHEEDVQMFPETSEPTRPDESVDSAISLPGSDDGKQAPQDDSAASGLLPSELSHPADELPLYRPPPTSQSPEQAKRHQHMRVNSVTGNAKVDEQLASSGSGLSKDEAELARLLQQDNLVGRQ